MQRGQIVVGVEARRHLALRDRMIAAVRHVLFARPQQLDRRARHLLGDQHGLADIVGLAAPAEAAAEHQLVHVAFVRGQARRLPAPRRTPLRRSACRTRPRICPPCRARWRSSAPWWRGSGRDSCRPPRPSWRRRRVAALTSPFWLPTKAGCAPSRPSDSHLAIDVARDFGVLAFVPDDRQRIERGLGVPPGVGDDGDRGVADLHHLLDAFHVGDLGFVVALQLAAERPGNP